MVDPQSLIKDIAISSATFDIGDNDNNHIHNLIKLKLPLEFLQVPNYRYQFWQYTHIHQLTKTYHNIVKVAREMQSGLDTNTATRMDGLGIVDS